jgi:hypothetical protein
MNEVVKLVELFAMYNGDFDLCSFGCACSDGVKGA